MLSALLIARYLQGFQRSNDSQTSQTIRVGKQSSGYERSMKIASRMSFSMVVPSSHTRSQPWIVSCRMEQQKPIMSLSTTPSQVGFNPASLALDTTKERIRKVLISNVELLDSAYDTAWVAMVPSPNSPNSPYFPECLKWLMENQRNDGSWGLLHHNQPSLTDSFSSTLACIVALKQWNVGHHQINRGLHFIELSLTSGIDKNQAFPFGFDIILHRMLEYAENWNIKLLLKEKDLSVIHERPLEFRSCDFKGREAYWAYISEGLSSRNSYEWNKMMKYQMKNGSILNSPSATAAALIHHQNPCCLNYLTSLLNKFGNAVPTVYLYDLYVQLSTVDTLENLGIARHFTVHIQSVLDDAFIRWVQRDEHIFMDVVTCALAFRVLRTNGYEVFPGPLYEVMKEGSYLNKLEDHLKGIYAALEVYKASQILYQDELSFGEQNMGSADFLKQKISTASSGLSERIQKEVEDTLKLPFNAHFKGLATKRNIEHYNLDDTRILKTTYSGSNIRNHDYLRLAVEDFNGIQLVFQKELNDHKRWVVEHKLDTLKFARDTSIYCYFGAASAFSSPELSDARTCWARSSLLTSWIDDFYDTTGSVDELVNLTWAIKKWNVDVDTDCCSENVRILFLALKDTILWTADNAFKWQGRDVTSHVIQLWSDVLEAMLREAIWAKTSYVPTINEYIENGLVSFALGPFVLPTLYFIGPKLSQEIIQSSEYQNLYELVSIIGRLLNDTRTFKRELEAGQLNAVTLHKNFGKSEIPEEEVVEEIKTMIIDHERKLMKLVLDSKGSIVPRACKDPFWKMCNILNVFYGADDGFTGMAIHDIVKEIIYEPVSHSSLRLY